MKIPDSNKIISLFYLLALLVVVFVVYKLLAGVGLIKTSASKKADIAKAAAVTDLTTDKYFDPEYFRTVTGYKGLTVAEATDRAKKLRNAMAVLGTDEETIFVIFANLPSKVAISEVANRYKAQYGFPWYIKSDNLQADLLDELTAAEVQKLMTLINKLPIS
jgi:hypothetical protein